jgi:hypothetical protein
VIFCRLYSRKRTKKTKADKDAEDASVRGDSKGEDDDAHDKEREGEGDGDGDTDERFFGLTAWYSKARVALFPVFELVYVAVPLKSPKVAALRASWNWALNETPFRPSVNSSSHSPGGGASTSSTVVAATGATIGDLESKQWQPHGPLALHWFSSVHQGHVYVTGTGALMLLMWYYGRTTAGRAIKPRDLEDPVKSPVLRWAASLDAPTSEFSVGKPLLDLDGTCTRASYTELARKAVKIIIEHLRALPVKEPPAKEGEFGASRRKGKGAHKKQSKIKKRRHDDDDEVVRSADVDLDSEAELEFDGDTA